MNSSLFLVWKVPYQMFYLGQHIVHPILRMWMSSDFALYNMIHSTRVKFSRMFRNVSWCWQKLSVRAQHLIVVLMVVIPHGVSLSNILLSSMLEKYVVCNICGLRSTSFEFSSVLYITPTYTSSMQKIIQQKLKSPVSDVTRTLGMWNWTIFYSLQSIWLLLLIGLDTLTTMLPKIGVLYLWIWPLCLVSINSSWRLP